MGYAKSAVLARMSETTWRTTGGFAAVIPLKPRHMCRVRFGTPPADIRYMINDATEFASPTAAPKSGNAYRRITMLRQDYRVLNNAWWRERRETGTECSELHTARSRAWAGLVALNAPETL